ncbi:hypothetical protein C8R45DRAFT_1209982 [Mycena sanguinolenta]|nr:hypothetical protein C8R45DRAFT_1209982 [Mycena sanguinolenta]
MPVKRKPPQPKSNLFKPTDSPFFDLFAQNRVPSLKETETLQELLAEKKAHLSHLNAQVPKRRPGKKHKVPSELRAELFYTRRFLEFPRAFIAPWRQLPVEIMSEIFLLTLEARKDNDDEPCYDDREGTILLCKICSTWRAIALRTPGLWNTLYIFLFGPFDPLDYAWISTWLARSGSSPVYLQLLWSKFALTDTINSVISIFVSHLHHATELALDGLRFFGVNDNELDYPKPTFKPSVESLTAPLLSAVQVHLPEGSIWDWIHTACRVSPYLTQLHTSHSSLDFPITNLTGLGWIHPAPMSRLFQIFEDAPNLRHVHINVEGPVVPSSTKSRLTMKSVLKLEVTSYDHLGDFLEQTEFPNVADLYFSFVDTWPDGPTFHSFLSRSSCALTALTFHDCIISLQQIVDCLRHRACDTLETFSVRKCAPRLNAADMLLQHLTYHEPEKSLHNPKLRTIELHDIRATDGLLFVMVESRARYPMTLLSTIQPAPTRLEEVQFTFSPAETQKTDHPEDWQRLRELKLMMRGELKIVWPGVGFAA